MVSGHAPGTAVAGITVAFTILATLTTIMRLYTRIRIVHTGGLDDIAILLATSCTIVLTATMCQQVKYGLGQHASTLSPHDYKFNLIWFWASVWIYILSLCFTKLSILLQYLRIFSDRRVRGVIYTLIGLILAWTVWAFFSALLACTPIRHFWDPETPGTCLARAPVWFSNAAFIISSDICTVVLPLPVLGSLNLPKRQKRFLLVIFGLGGVSCIVSIMRLHPLYAISKSSDVSWDNPLAAIWSSLEVNIGILCSCLPTLKRCISRFFPTLFVSLSGEDTACGPSFLPVLENFYEEDKSSARCSAVPHGHDKPRSRLSRLWRKFCGSGQARNQDVERDCKGSSDVWFSSPGPSMAETRSSTVGEKEERKGTRIGDNESESDLGSGIAGFKGGADWARKENLDTY